MPFFPNPKFIEELIGEPAYKAVLHKAADAARANAEAHAKRVMPNKKGRKPIEVVERDDQVYLANTNHGGHIEEFGSVNSPPLAPLRKGIEAAGLRVGE